MIVLYLCCFFTIGVGCSEDNDEEVNSEASDSRSVATTLIIQDIQRGISERKHALGEPCELSPPISEILDSRTRSLMQLINKEGYQGYVLSNHLVASALAMVSEDRYMNKVYGELLSCQGNQIQIRKARDYINIAKKEPLSFWDVACLARMSEEIAIGFIPVPDQSMETDKPEVKLNPENKGEPRIWNAQDRIIVIAMCRQVCSRKRRLPPLRFFHDFLPGHNFAPHSIEHARANVGVDHPWNCRQSTRTSCGLHGAKQSRIYTSSFLRGATKYRFTGGSRSLIQERRTRWITMTIGGTACAS